MNQNSKSGWGVFFVLSSAILIVTGCSSPRNKSDDTMGRSRPNIIFILSDDHAYQAISAYNYPIGKLAQTPNIDRLADEGMIFNRMFVGNSLCGPSRATILTGKFSHLNGFKRNGDTFNPDQPTFPKMLQTSGYETAAVGKWHLASLPTGFDSWCVVPGQGNYYNPDFIKQSGDTVRM